jgi:hypothetical protein
MYSLVDNNKVQLVMFIFCDLCIFFCRIFFRYKAICLHELSCPGETYQKWAQIIYSSRTVITRNFNICGYPLLIHIYITPLPSEADKWDLTQASRQGASEELAASKFLFVDN